MEEYKSIKAPTDQFMQKLKIVTVDSCGITGLESGIHNLDEITNGFQDGDVITIAGRPAMGKTAFALSMVKNIAVERRQPVLYISPSMTGEKIVKRLLAMVSKKSISRVQSGILSVDEWSEVERGESVLRESPIYIDDTPGISIEKLEEDIRLFARKNKVKVIFVDYLQLIGPRKQSNRTRNEEIADIIYTLKTLAMELQIPIIVLSQVSRPSETMSMLSQEYRPRLNDLQDSEAIEAVSDIVLFIHRPEYYHIYQDEYGNELRGITEILIEKNLMGRRQSFKLKSDYDIGVFSPTDQPFFNKFHLHNPMCGLSPFG